MSHSDTLVGRLNVKQEEIDEMLKEAPGPINFTVFLTMFGEKLKGKDLCSNTESVKTRPGELCWRCHHDVGADPEETILNAFKVFDPEGKGVLRKD